MGAKSFITVAIYADDNGGDTFRYKNPATPRAIPLLIRICFQWCTEYRIYIYIYIVILNILPLYSLG
jgi:hypothetical protein